jgi:hypothetical protein
MKHVQRDDGREAIPDDMPPGLRAVAFLLEHATQRRDEGLPLPCPCRQCEGRRLGLRAVVLEDGTLAIEEA